MSFCVLSHDGHSSFGAGVIAPGTGFILNNEMDDFTSKVGAPNQFGLRQGKANQIQPGKRPLSSMSPTIVTKDGKVKWIHDRGFVGLSYSNRQDQYGLPGHSHEYHGCVLHGDHFHGC